MSPDWWRDCRDGIEKCSSPTGDGNFYESSFLGMYSVRLRNVVPRQGTEIILAHSDSEYSVSIEKCSSPTGDGNFPTDFCRACDSYIEKCSSPTGDGNLQAHTAVKRLQD